MENSYAFTLELFFLRWGRGVGSDMGVNSIKEGCKRWVRESILEKFCYSHGIMGDGPKPVLDRALGFPCLDCDLKAGFHGPESSSWSLHLATQADSRVCFLLHGKSGTRGSRAVLPRDINSKRRQESLSHISEVGMFMYVCVYPQYFQRQKKEKVALKN